MVDLTTLTDSELFDHQNEVLAEQERRQRITNYPEQVIAMAAAMKADGESLQPLVDAIMNLE